MRGRYLFATLKNRLDPRETVDLTLKVRDLVQAGHDRLVGICPSAAAMAWTSACKGELAIAAQTCGWTASYSLTGELSVRDLKVFSIAYCIVGHSERRLYLGETEEIISRRLSALLSASITPILCVGETLEQRQSKSTVDVVRGQLCSLLAAFKMSAMEPHPSRTIVAYEPMWAISTAASNLTLKPEDAVATHGAVRRLLDEIFGSGFGQATSIIFGGSLNSANAKDFFVHPTIDGGLVGSGMQTVSGFGAVLDAFYCAKI
jgi:triosephosphate isomerase